MVGVSPPNALTEFSLYPAWLDFSGNRDTIRVKAGHPTYTGDEPDSILIAIKATSYPDSDDVCLLRFWVEYNAGTVGKYWDTLTFTEPAILYASAWVYEGGAGNWSSRSQASVLMPNWTYRNVYPFTISSNDTSVMVQRDATPISRSYSGQNAVTFNGSNNRLMGRGDTLLWTMTSSSSMPVAIYMQSGNYTVLDSLTVIQIANSYTGGAILKYAGGGASHHDNEIRYCNLHPINDDMMVIYMGTGPNWFTYAQYYRQWVHHNNLTNFSQAYTSRAGMPCAAIHAGGGGTFAVDINNSYGDTSYTFKVNNNVIDSMSHTAFYLCGKVLFDSNTILLNRHNDRYTYPSGNSGWSAENAFGLIMIGNVGADFAYAPDTANGGILGRYEEGIHAGTKIRWNNITIKTGGKSAGGRGIGLGGSGSDANPMEIAWNYIVSGEGPDDATNDGTARAIKIENASGNFLLHHNTIIALSDSVAATTGIGTSAVGLQLSAWRTAGPTIDTCFGYMRIYNNRVYGICDSVGTNSEQSRNEATALSIAIAPWVDSVYTWNNYFMGNCFVVYNGWSTNVPMDLFEWISIGDTFNFTLHRIRSSRFADSAVVKLEQTGTKKGNIIRNPVFINTSSAGYHTVSTDSLLWTQRSCSLMVANPFGLPISGATYTVKNNYDKTVGSGVTGSGGYIPVNLNYRYDGTTDSTGFNPHSFIVSASGYAPDTFFVTLTDNLFRAGFAVQDTFNMGGSSEPTKIIMRYWKK
jgi:hypothetical protein